MIGITLKEDIPDVLYFSGTFWYLGSFEDSTKEKEAKGVTQVCGEDESSLHLNMTLSEPSGASGHCNAH